MTLNQCQKTIEGDNKENVEIKFPDNWTVCIIKYKFGDRILLIIKTVANQFSIVILVIGHIRTFHADFSFHQNPLATYNASDDYYGHIVLIYHEFYFRKQEKTKWGNNFIIVSATKEQLLLVFEGLFKISHEYFISFHSLFPNV